MKSIIDKDFALIETILWSRAAKGESPLHHFFLLKRHINRAEYSASFFAFKFDKKGLLDKLSLLHKYLINKTDIETAKIRALFFKDGKIDIEYFKLIPDKNRELFIDISSKRVNSKDIFLYHKTTKRELFNSERERAVKEGLFETIFFNENGELTEGTITNIFLDLNENVLITPKLSCGLLPGTFRQELLEKGETREEILTVDHLKSAKKIYLGNSIRRLIEVKLKT